LVWQECQTLEMATMFLPLFYLSETNHPVEWTSCTENEWSVQLNVYNLSEWRKALTHNRDPANSFSLTMTFIFLDDEWWRMSCLTSRPHLSILLSCTLARCSQNLFKNISIWKTF
jgi:hypothetical protein